MKRVTTYILVLVLVSSIIHISLSLSTRNVKAVTYIDGDWIVTGAESYTDEEIILSGNLTVETGGSLVLANVTLAMNCSFNGQYHIRVNSGGSLIVTDGDNNPWTTDDFSNITDSPFDNDGGGGDYKYFVEVLSGGSVSINNTIIRECGYSSDPFYGFYVYSDTSSFENSIFRSNLQGLILEGNNSEIRNCTFDGNKDYGIRSVGNDNNIINCTFKDNVDYGILSSGNGNIIQNCTFENSYYAIWIDSGELDNDIQECTFENNTNAIRVTGDNTDVHNCTLKNNDKGIYVGTDVNNSDIQNCTFENDKISSNNYGINIYSAKNFTIGYSQVNYCRDGIITTAGTSDGSIYHNEVHHCDYGMKLEGDNLIVYNNTIHNNTDVYDTINPGQSGMLLDNLANSDIYNNTIENSGLNGASDRFNLNVQSCDNLKIHINTIQKVKQSGISVNISYSSNIDFYDNNVTNNSGTGIYVELGASDTNIRIHNNNISYNTPIGLEVVGTPTSYVEIIDNVLIDNGNTVVDQKSRGIGLHMLQAYTISGNTINSNTGDPSYKGDAVWINEAHGGDFSNNTMDGNQYDLYLDELDTGWEFTDFYVVNCTLSTSKVGFWDLFQPFLHIQNFLHVQTFDLNGSLPYVDISVKNIDTDEVHNVKTDEFGGVWYLIVTNQIIESSLGTVYFDPHNITGTYDVYTAYGDIEPVMDTTRWVNVYFNIDTPPQPPANLIAVSNGTNIDLTWTPSPSNDLSHYLVFRNDTGPGWVEIYNSSSLPWPDSINNNWTDNDAASGWATYSYKVQAVDNISQGSEDSNIAKCGDWVISDTQVISDLTVQLNGTLIILPTGNLTLRNVTIKFNNSYLLEYGIEVKSGGELYILDSDNDPQTTTDQSNISALNPNKGQYFIMNGSKFEMRNSRLSDCGSKQNLNFGYWSPSSGDQVMSVGAPWERGLYIGGASEVVIENNNFTNNFVSLLLNGIDYKSIEGNSFSDNVFGIYLNNSNNNSINNNTFSAHQAFPIYLYNSENNTIYSNELTNVAGLPGGIVLYDGGCKFNKIIDNTMTTTGQDLYGPYGISIYHTGIGNNATNNTIMDHERGIHINNSDWSILLENDFSNSLSYDCLLEYANNTVIQGSSSIDSNYSFFINMSTNIKMSNITIENALYGIYDWHCDDLTLADIYLNSCGKGTIIFGGDTILFSNITIEDGSIGVIIRSNPVNIELYDSQIFGSVQYAMIIENCDSLDIYNSSLNATMYNFDLASADITLYNTTYNQIRVIIDPLSTITLYWLLDVEVLDWEDDPVYDANVKIRNPLGTLVYNGSTDINGFIRLIWLHERTQYPNSNETYIPYNIEAILGNHSGSKSLLVNRTMQTNVTLDNSLPSVTNVIISPLTPTTLDDLNLSYNYSDPEGDLEINTSIMWYVNAVHNSTFDNQTLIPNASTSKDQTWYCEVRPYDGSAYGPMMTSTPVTIQNTPPVVSDVKINQTDPTSSDDLNVNFTFSDIDGDDNIQSQYRWYVDKGSGWEYSNVDALELPASYTKKGEKWKCNVTPNDGDNLGITVESAFVTIGNTAPEVSNVIIKPVSPMSNETLTANYTYFDLDDDLESGGTIRWFKNGTLQPGLNDSKTVDSSITLKGEVWNYTITPSDGEDNGTPVQSDPAYIENTPPSVSNIVINPSNPTTQDRLNVTYVFDDSDGDSEDKNNTVVKWLRWNGFEFYDTGYRGHNLSSEFTEKDDIWMCEVIPHDGLDEGISNLSSMNVTIMNSAPMVSNIIITPSNPDADTNLTASYDFDDVDGDSETGSMIRWYKDGILQSNLNDSINVSFMYTSKGEIWYYNITPHDGEENGTKVKSENITIGNTPPTVSNIVISPLVPTTEDDLVANFDFNDTDGDTQSGDTVIKWLCWSVSDFFDTGLRGKTLPSIYTSKDERWTCEVIPHDGSNEGTATRSDMNVTIINTEPEITNAIIIPLNPTSDSILTANYTFLDPDGDAETGSTIRWFRDGLEQIDLAGSKSVHFSRTQSGEVWYYNVTPYDGEDYGTLVQSESLVIGNTPPWVENIMIALLNPVTGDDLTVDYDFYDSDGDDESNNTIVKWLLWSGAVFYDTGYSGNTLFSAYTTKGDIWTCEVIPHDGLDFGTAKTSNMNVTINNSAPMVTRASSIPTNPISESDITVDYDFFDPDGDLESGSTIQWFRNGLEQVDLSGSLIVDSSRTLKGDTWYYNITPSDGEDMGITVQSDDIIIGNTPPQVSNIGVTPLVPTTEDDLVVEYDFFDSDGDTESGDTIIKWLRWTGIEFVDTGYRGKTLPSAYTLKEERWTCEITPHDGMDYGTSVEWSSNVTIINSKPVVEDLLITPTDPTTTSTLVANYLYSDVDYDLENDTKIVWYLNGVHEPTLDNQTFIPSNLISKGQPWYFTVESNDGTEFGEVVISGAIEVMNSPPTASDLSISPNNPLGDDDLNALYTYEDEDGDVESTPEIRWYKNGILQPAYNDQLVVDSSATEKSKLWYFTLKVFDGEEYGEAINSPYVEIENSRPVITSLTPTPGQIVLSETESIEFLVVAGDPDGDAMLFKWKIGLATVGDGEYYKFETDYESAGTYTLNLSIQDIGERSFTLFREWEIVVNNLNRMPEIGSPDPVEKELVMEEDTSLQFSIVASDPDPEDDPEINWYFDENFDVPVQEGGSSYTYYADHAAAGSHVVTAEVDDGLDSVQYSWNLTVEDVIVKEPEELFGFSYDWWGLVMAIVSAIAALIIFTFGFFMVRRKKGALRRYMTEINNITSDKELEPGEFDEKMDDVESRLNEEFQSGKIEDLHFHMIQDTIATRRRDFRKAEVSEKFEGLPKWITQEMEVMLKDGKISRTEYEGFVSIISKTKGLTPQQKEELSEMIGEWEGEDKDSTIDDLEDEESDDADDVVDEEEEITDSEDESYEDDADDETGEEDTEDELQEPE